MSVKAQLTDLIYEKDSSMKAQIQDLHVDLAKVEHQGKSVNE